MTDPSTTTTDVETLDHAALAAFASRLSAYASGLSEQDRLALSTLLLRAMDPLERMRWRDAAQLLSPGEEAILRQLLEQPPTT